MALRQPAMAGWRRIVALLAVLGVLTLLSHEFAHYVHADAPDSCAFGYIANSVPPAPPPALLPAPALVATVVWFVGSGAGAPSCSDPHRSARGPPAR